MCAGDFTFAHCVCRIREDGEQLRLTLSCRDFENFFARCPKLWMRARREMLYVRDWHLACAWESGRDPRFDSAGEDHRLIVAVIVEHPDHASGVGFVAAVVGNN